jgi:hypothetical protein
VIIFNLKPRGPGYRDNGRLQLLKHLAITRLFRRATAQLGPQHRSTPSNVSAKSLGTSGAKALLNERSDANMIKLIGSRKTCSATFMFKPPSHARILELDAARGELLPHPGG